MATFKQETEDKISAWKDVGAKKAEQDAKLTDVRQRMEAVQAEEREADDLDSSLERQRIAAARDMIQALVKETGFGLDDLFGPTA